MLRFLLLFLPLSLSAVPLRFEINRGQFPSSVLITSRGVAFTKSGPQFSGGIRMTLAGGRASVPLATAPAGHISYLVGPDPANWRLGVPQYNEVHYREVYPGIDLLFHDAAGRLEYDFHLRCGADPHSIRLRFRGAGSVRLDGEDLVAGSLRHHRPTAYQDAPSGRRAVAVRYRLQKNGEVRFELGPYDRGLPLVIDPVLSYATYAGGSGVETGNAVAVDNSGNAYLAGYADSPDFPAIKGASIAGPHAFVARLDAAGANFTSTAVIGGATIDGIAMDSTGSPIITGSITNMALFPGATAGAYHAGATGFVARLTQDASGFKLAFVSTFAATPAAVALDPKDFIYVTGMADATFVTTPGALQSASAGGASDAFALKLSSDGTRALYATFLGGKFEDAGRAIAVNSGGEAYLAGDTASDDFPLTPGAAQSTFGGRVLDQFGRVYGDAFVAKLDAAGAHLVFSTYLGGKAADVAYGIALDKDGNAYVTGGTQSADFPASAGAVQPVYAGGTPVRVNADPAGDAFAARFTVNGARVWATFLGGSDRDLAEAIAVDSAGNVVVAGTADSANFPRTAGALSGCRTGGPWVAQLDSMGTRLLVSTSLPGMGLDEPHALALDARGIAYLAGDATSRVFFATPGAAQQVYGGGDSDAFAARLDLSAANRLSVACVLNAASYQAGNFSAFPIGTVAPGEIVSVFGSAVGPDQPAIAQPAPGTAYPTTLGGTQVFFDGVPAPLLYSGANQVNVIVPYGIKSPATQMTVQRGGISDGPRALPVAPAVPAVFTANSAGFGQAAVLNEDGSYNSVANPAARGSMIVLYAVGAGAMNPPVAEGAVSPGSLPLPVPQLPVTVQIRGVEVDPVYAGAAPGYVSGLLQVNVRVPDSVNFGNSVPLTLLVGGQASQFNVTIAVK